MLRLGIIGLSPGNGHPYSWSAICNGYDPGAMASCGFPVIPAYLGKQEWPAARLDGVEVTHVWTQDRPLSEAVAAAAHIGAVVDKPADMIGCVDGVLLARDDAENHAKFALPFLTAGMPIYIDKPLALTSAAADALYAEERFPGQIFTCSALRYAEEFRPTEADWAEIGPVRMISGTVPKCWETYAVHLIDPILSTLGADLSFERVVKVPIGTDGRRLIARREDGVLLDVTTLGTDTVGPLSFRIHGRDGWKEFAFRETFPAFRAALADFAEGVNTRTVRSAPSFNRRVVELIEMGRPA